jgi:hypothetical protein
MYTEEELEFISSNIKQDNILELFKYFKILFPDKLKLELSFFDKARLLEEISWILKNIECIPENKMLCVICMVNCIDYTTSCCFTHICITCLEEIVKKYFFEIIDDYDNENLNKLKCPTYKNNINVSLDNDKITVIDYV